MESLAAAAEVVEMSVDDFAEQGSEQYGLQDAAANDEAQRPAEEAAAAQDENIASNTVPCAPEIAHPKVVNAPKMPLRTR